MFFTHAISSEALQREIAGGVLPILGMFKLPPPEAIRKTQLIL